MKRVRFLLLSFFLLPALIACGSVLEVGIEPSWFPRPECALGKLAYVRGGDVWIEDLCAGGEAPRRLTEDGINSAPRWSPSGRWLLVKKGPVAWVIDTAGGRSRPLPTGGSLDEVAWSPVQDLAAYIGRRGQLVVEDAEGMTQTILLSSSTPAEAERVECFAWHPSGEWLAYQVARAGKTNDVTPAANGQEQAQLGVVSAHGQPRIPLAIEDGPGERVRLAGWSGDGTRVLYWQGLASASIWADGVELKSVSLNDGGSESLAATMLPREDFIAPRPGSSQLALAVGSGRQTWQEKQVVLVDTAEDARRVLSQPGQVATSPAWSPSGRSLAYVAAPGEPGSLAEKGPGGLLARSIWLAEVDGTGQRHLTDNPAHRDEAPHWSADGEQILFVRLADGEASLWLVDSEGGEPRPVVTDLGLVDEMRDDYGHVEWDCLFDWWTGLIQVPGSPPLQATAAPMIPQAAEPGLLYLQDGAVYHVGGNGAEAVGAIPPTAGHFALSPAYLAYADDTTIALLELETGTTRDLVDLCRRPGQDLDLGWLANGTSLAYAVAWREPDGSRIVDLAVTDGRGKTHLDTIVARPPGPTPTPPLLPPIPAQSGFADLTILGGDREAGYLIVTPAGGTERYSAVWVYDLLRIGQRAKELSLPQPEQIVSLAPSPDLAWIAVSYADPGAELGRLYLYPFLGEEASGGGPSVEAPRLVKELSGLHLTDLRWSPDSRQLAYLHREGVPALDASPVAQLDILFVETGRTTTVTVSHEVGYTILGWTADDRALVLEVMDRLSGEEKVQLIDPGSGQTIHELDVPGGARVLGWIGGIPALE